jgi:hypothetical protein
MDTLRETMNIGNICRESEPERFQHALKEVPDNINDINRPAPNVVRCVAT